MNWEGLVVGVLAALLLYSLYSSIKSKPEAFSLENFQKSSYVLGVLALFLIVLITFAVLILKGS